MIRVLRRFGRWAAAVMLAVGVLAAAGACSPMELTGAEDLGEQLKFGNDTVVNKEMVISRMEIPADGLGEWIGQDEIRAAVADVSVNPGLCNGSNWDDAQCKEVVEDVRDQLAATAFLQCDALEKGYQEESPDEGAWEPKYADDDQARTRAIACEKKRKISWLEATLWALYEDQSAQTISWLTTSRNTLVASPSTVGTLQANDEPMYDGWFSILNKYLPVLQGLLAVCAAVSLVVVGARVVSNTREGLLGEDHRLLDRTGWVFLGVFAASSCVSIACTFFKPTRDYYRGEGFSKIPVAPHLQSWTPGEGYGYFVSDWVRMQVDPFLIIAAVLGVFAAGYKLVTTQEGRDLVPLGKALMWAIVTSVCLAGAVNLVTGVVDVWTSDVLSRASSMMRDAWESNTLASWEFFRLDPLLAFVLTFILWLCNLIGKIFTYLRAGMLPILVGVAPVFAAMSWNEHGRQSFGKVLGTLVAFLLYKPIAALVMATGSAIMVTAGKGDDSQAITLTLTIMVVVMLPAMIRTIVPAVASNVSGGGATPAVLGTAAGAMGGAAASGLRTGGRLGGKALGALGSLGSKIKGAVAPDGAKKGGASGARALSSGAAAPAGKDAKARTAASAGAKGAPRPAPSDAEGGAPDGADRDPGRARGAQSAQRPSPPPPAGPAGSARSATSRMAEAMDPSGTPPAPAPAPDGADRKAARRGEERTGGVMSNGF